MSGIFSIIVKFIVGIACFVLSFFCALPDRQREKTDESWEVRVWFTFVAFAVLVTYFAVDYYFPALSH